MCGVGTPVSWPSSITAPTSASISGSRPASTSCSIDVLCLPTFSAPAMRFSSVTRKLTPSLFATCSASRIIAAASSRVGELADVDERRVRERADRIEGEVAPELEPDLGADAGEHGRLEPGAHERFGESHDARRLRAVGLAEREAVALDVAHDAGRRQLARRVDDAADDPRRVDRAHDRAVRIDGGDAAALERPAVALEVPPRDAVLHRHDHGLVVEEVMQVLRHRRDLVRLHAEDHDVVGPASARLAVALMPGAM